MPLTSPHAKVRDHLPLQQGLRLTWGVIATTSLTIRTRPSSITTRIKTLHALLYEHPLRVRDHLPLQQGLRHNSIYLIDCSRASTRPSSITTRIKTHSHLRKRQQSQVRDHLPLQQGLRP